MINYSIQIQLKSYSHLFLWFLTLFLFYYYRRDRSDSHVSYTTDQPNLSGDAAKDFVNNLQQLAESSRTPGTRAEPGSHDIQLYFSH